MPLYRNEDEAIKLKLTGLSLPETNDPNRSVPVRFRAPQLSFADQKYPLLLLDRVDTAVDYSRAHAGYIQLPYAPEGYRAFVGAPDSRRSPYFTEFPVPLNLDYTVSLYCRRAEDQTTLLAQLTTFDRLPLRYGYLVVPQDNTVRRLDVLGGPETDNVLDELGKRLLRAVWRVRTVAEFLWAPIDQPQPVTAVDLTVTQIGPAT